MLPVRVLAAFVSIAVLALIAALPWGLPPQDRFFLPIVPVIAIHFWGLRHPGLVPEWYAFAVGLGLDVLTHGPLGYWALIYLSAHLVAVLSAPLADRGLATRLGLLVAALVIVTGAAWAVASVYFLEWLDIWPYAAGAGLAGLGACLLMPLLHMLDPARATRDNVRLERGV
jgi:rod shape-determining protein MreD